MLDSTCAHLIICSNMTWNVSEIVPKELSKGISLFMHKSKNYIKYSDIKLPMKEITNFFDKIWIFQNENSSLR